MNVSLRPELEKYVDEQVKAGRFASVSEAVEAGIARLMLDPALDALDDMDVVEIRDSLAQMQRGEVIDWREYSRALRQKYLRE